RQREHAVHLVAESASPRFVAVNRDLDVAPGRKRVAQLLEPPSQCLEVVQLAVAGDDDVPGLAVDRLMATSDVDDAEPAYREGAIGIVVLAGLVGPAMHQGARHGAHFVQAVGKVADRSRDATHAGAIEARTTSLGITFQVVGAPTAGRETEWRAATPETANVPASNDLARGRPERPERCPAHGPSPECCSMGRP